MAPSHSPGLPRHARRRSIVASLAAGALIASIVAGTTGAATTLHLTAVAAQPRIAGTTSGNNLSPELIETEVARGSIPLENASADGVVAYYGYLNDGDPLLPVDFASPKEAQKTEPDKNTYLVLKGQHGADPAYDYGSHFLYAGHELGPRGYVTRVNLDADPAHKVTLLASTQIATPNLPAGNLPVIDGSVWNPFTKTLLFSFEGNGSTTGGIWEATPDFPSTVVDRLGLFGRGGYEGIQEDNDGNIWLVEDIGGKNGTTGAGLATNNAKQPNSFVFRFVPYTKGNLDNGGKLQVLQVTGKNDVPSTFTGGAAPTQAQIDGDITSQFMKDLHTYGNAFQTRWITIHDTRTDGTATFNANVLAKTNGGTPFKRPENGQFRPAFGFTEFVFTETGDTNVTSGANGPSGASFGGWGGLFRLSQVDPSANTGILRPFFLGDIAHTGLDNITFLDRNNVISVEDAGDGVHAARNGLDSAFVFHYGSNGRSATPLRFLGEGRDPSATLDSANAGFGKNETDNEITGIHLSDGNATVSGLIGTRNPLFRFPSTRGADRWRLFWTAQHGDNVTSEILIDPH
jgi:Bacterial protein of unknown function (DUF839)